MHYGKELGKDFSLDDLRSQGFESVFLGVGLQKANMGKNDRVLQPSIQKAMNATNFADSKSFLKKVYKSVKIDGKP